MQVAIITNPLQLDLHGFSAMAVNKDYSGTAFRLMDRLWKTVQSFQLKNKGLNTWVYGPDQKVFAGVGLEEIPPAGTELEHLPITLPKYAYYKHIGPYNLIGQAGKAMREHLQAAGHRIISPYIEIYGHWNANESLLETELLMAVS